ncbi:MAG TPA: hypothetical protein VEC19_11105 [Usitatibacter sp.]|nr:hypothetical protein [Usitatibacter sp.]
MRTELIRRLVAIALAAGAATAAWGQGAASQVPMLDPWVPPEVREKATVQGSPTSGEALRVEVERKLRARFEAAAGRGGTLSREQARSAGLGAIARDFEAIDQRQSGRIGFEDYKAFLRSRGAAL